MSTILITGGLGFIGSHTAVEFLNHNYKLIVVDDLSNSDLRISKNIKNITKQSFDFYKIDVTNNLELEKHIFSRYTIDAIIHFAAKKSVNESVEEPLLYYDNNINSLLNLLSLSVRYKVKKFIFSSSCTVYGQPDKLPVDEEQGFQKSQSPYGSTKQICEHILADFVKAQPSYHVIALRYFNPIGAHHSGQLGELPRGKPSNLLPYLTQTAIGWRKKLFIFGNDYNTPDGTAIRDYIHVADLANAHLIATEHLLKHQSLKRYDYFNIGTGKGYSVAEIVHTFEEVNQIKINYEIVGRRPGDIEKIYSNVQKSNTLLKWKARHDLKDMLSSAWVWQNYLEKENWLKNEHS